MVLHPGRGGGSPTAWTPLSLRLRSEEEEEEGQQTAAEPEPEAESEPEPTRLLELLVRLLGVDGMPGVVDDEQEVWDAPAVHPAGPAPWQQSQRRSNSHNAAATVTTPRQQSQRSL